MECDLDEVSGQMMLPLRNPAPANRSCTSPPRRSSSGRSLLASHPPGAAVVAAIQSLWMYDFESARKTVRVATGKVVDTVDRRPRPVAAPRPLELKE